MPARGDGITKRKDGLFMARYTIQTPDGPKRKTIYSRKYKQVEKKLAEAKGDAAKGIYFDDENMTVSEYITRWLGLCQKPPCTGQLPQLQAANSRTHRACSWLSEALEAHTGARAVPVRREAAGRHEARKRPIHPCSSAPRS